MFDETGRIRSMLLLTQNELTPDDLKAFYTNTTFVKTQFAPIDVHITIVKLLKYIKKKYFPSLNVSDEGEYWETGDEALLKKNLDLNAYLIKEVKNALEKEKIPQKCNGRTNRFSVGRCYPKNR